MSGPLYLGVDGGATRCRARIADAAGRTLGAGEAGPANPRLDMRGATDAILAATHAALAAAGLGADAIGTLRAGLGLAGVGQRKDRAAFAAWAHPFAAMAFATDAHAALFGAHGGRDGAILILGTGSCGLALVGGAEHRVGGWGFPISDAASGAWIGLSCLRRALDGHDGVRPATPFTRAVMARFDDDPERAVAFQETARSGDYGAIAPLAFDHHDDPAAAEILDRATQDAAALSRALLATGAPRLSLLGGVSALLAPGLPADVRDHLVPPEGDALAGALTLAQGIAPRTG
jgi:glucosamine kinase